MIISIILIIVIYKIFSKAYRKSVAHNMSLFGNYMYEVIRKANEDSRR